MRNEDEDFANIIKEEFDEQWSPSAPTPASAEPERVRQPDFHIEMYDDEESYRSVHRSIWHLSHLSAIGAILVLAGLLIGLGRVLRLGLPPWSGWIAIVCFLAGIGLWIWHLTHARRDDDDDEAVV